MKLDVDFSTLWMQVNKMGGGVAKFELDKFIVPFNEIDTSLSEEGIEVKLEELESLGGLLGYKGRQILLYIPDQGWRIDQVLNDGSVGKKFHVSQCKTLTEMREKGRFQRYVAVNDLSGEFDVHGVDRDSRTEITGVAELDVCKNCLEKLNYKESIVPRIRKVVCAQFSIIEFFEVYSSVFSHIPKQLGMQKTQLGYPENWDELSARLRKKYNYTCQECNVSLENDKNLVHVHHINGVKSQCDESNLRVLCASCHRQQPMHSHVYVTKENMQIIANTRNEQNIKSTNWASAIRLADTAVHGILGILRDQGHSPPIIGYEKVDSKNAETSRFEFAWPKSRIGVVLTSGEKPLNSHWTIFTLEELINDNHRVSEAPG